MMIFDYQKFYYNGLRSKSYNSMLYLQISVMISCFALFGCEKKPGTVHFTPVMNVDEVEFHFNYENVNGLLAITVWEKETRKTLWRVSVPYFSGSSIIYGEIPPNYLSSNKHPQKATQRFPKDNEAALPLDTNEIIYIRISYQYDELSGATGGDIYYAFLLNENGILEDLGQQSPLIAGETDADIYEIIRKEYEEKQKDGK